MVIFLATAIAIAAAAGQPYVSSEPPKAVPSKGAISAVVLSPLFGEPFMCGDHPAREGSVVGDELGTDCQILGGVMDRPRGIGRLYRGDGSRNDDWFSWGASVLSPCDCVVEAAHANNTVNEPGTRGRPPAGFLLFRRADGVKILYAHLTDLAVASGDKVKAGQAVAKVGNNGPSYAPHVHVGAYKGLEPLQVRWDQQALGQFYKRLMEQRGAK